MLYAYLKSTVCELLILTAVMSFVFVFLRRTAKPRMPSNVYATGVSVLACDGVTE